jgi:hypothetical protein
MSADFSRARLRHALSRVTLALIALSTAARATTVVSKSFPDLCAQADMIFSATVGEVRSQRVDANRGDLETWVTFTAIEPILGVTTPTVTLRFAGGVVDGVREEFLGVPRFTTGERVVLFARQGYELSPVVGVGQGCFRVVESASGATVAAADGQPLIGLDSRAEQVDGGQGAGGDSLSLSRFLDEVRRELQAQGRHQ